MWKTTFGGRQPSVENDLWWKTTFSGLFIMYISQEIWLTLPGLTEGLEKNPALLMFHLYAPKHLVLLRSWPQLI